MQPRPTEASIVRFEEGDPAENPWINGQPKQERIKVEAYSAGLSSMRLARQRSTPPFPAC